MYIIEYIVYSMIFQLELRKLIEIKLVSQDFFDLLFNKEFFQNECFQ